MDRVTLVQPETKARIRELINKILLQQGLQLKDVAYQAGISYHMMWAFMNDKQAIGPRVMTKLAHWVLSNGYTLEDLKSN